MNPIKKLFRRLAVFFVTLWARWAYKQGVQAAERRHSEERRTIYLACNSFRPDHLVTYCKAQFKTEKKVYGVAARLLTMNTLKRRCYYYTADSLGRNPMDGKDKEIRRRKFIRERLRLAGLLEA